MAQSCFFGSIGRMWSGIRHRLSLPVGSRIREVDLPGQGVVKLDKSLNFVGDNCLRTVLITKLTIDRAKPGTVLEVVSDNLSAVETIPFMLPNCNCDHLATVSAGDCQKIYLRKRQNGLPPGQATGAGSAGPTGRESTK